MYIILLLLTSILHLAHSQSSSCNPALCLCTSNSCTNCLSSYFYIDTNVNQCLICDYRCSTCLGSDSCLTCAPGFYRDSASMNMTVFGSSTCRQCPIFCTQCQNETYCNQCIQGYVAVNGICKICSVPNVYICQSQMTVFSCLPGYWKNGDSCSPCRQFCQSCTSSTNCLSCADGYRVQVSAGTYCAACPTNCKTCSSVATCTACLKNSRLITGTCIPILQQCSQIPNCQQCQYTSGTVKCKICSYPYYLSTTTSTCVLGASILCINGATGMSRYQCLNTCSGVSKQIDFINQYVCGPRLWISGSDVTQYYYQGLNSWDQFIGTKLAYQSCSAQTIPTITSQTFTSTGQNTITLTKIFKPYYKLILTIKLLPIYKQISQSAQISFTVKMKDNSTIPLQFTQTLSTSDHIACIPVYYSLQSKIVKDQNVTIQFTAQLVGNDSNNGNLSYSNFTKGFLAFSEILIQVYRCSPECRICSNSKFCLQCYNSLFVYQNQCVSECYGFYQFYGPSGNITSYTYKQCLQKCPATFYSTQHPTKPNTYICTACLPPCLSCKSQQQCLSCISPYYYYDLQFVCRLDCPNTHYKSSVSAICVPCNSPCRTCLDQYRCLSCSIGYYYGENSSCVGVCPDLYYANTSSRNCQPCDPTCTKCINLPTNCLACKPTFYLLNNICLPSCPNLTHYPQTNKCQLCKPPCLQCQSQTSCLTCITGYLLNNICYTTCPDGYYSNFTANTCQVCTDGNCVRCISSSSCQMCGNGTYLYNGLCLFGCPARTYPMGSSLSNVGYACVWCVQPCFQCINSTYCISCQIGYMSLQQPGKCISQCQSGYYPSQKPNPNYTNTSSYNTLSIIKTCLLCSPECQTCKNNNTCLSCIDNSKVLDSNHQCVSSCPSGYYNHSRVCQICNYPCKSCSIGPQVCLSCHLPYILSGLTCIAQCGITQYQKNYQCYPCLYPCRTCLNQSYCTSCQVAGLGVQQTYLNGSLCLLTCPSLTYADTITLKCKPCNYPCLACSDSKKCITCASGYLNPTKMTCQLCPQTSFPNQFTKQCQPCNTTIQNCRICSSSTVCRYCFANYYFYDGRCIEQSQCKSISNYYPNSQQMVCSACIPPCGSCLNDNQCITCSTGFLYNMKCLLECPSGYYAALASSRCEVCDLSVCLTCSLGARNCLSCNTTGSKPIFMPSQSACISLGQCPSEFYIDYSFGYGRCVKCSSPCLTCTSARVCLSCLNGILYNGQCKTSCPLSFYESQSQNTSQPPQCLPCSSNCLQCRSTPSNCASCHQDHFIQNSSCVSQCSQGYYLDSSTLICKLCSNPCKTCTSSSNCLTCLTIDTNGNNLTNQIIYYGQCLQTCPDGTYESNLQCLKCPEQCQLCDSSGLCKKCAQGLFMNSSAPGHCSSQCQTTQYSDSYTRNCYPCQSPCQTCSSATSCNSCTQNYIIYINDCIKGTICPQNTFKYTNLSSSFISCVDKCPTPYFGNHFTRQCVQSCPYNYVKFSPTSLCIQQCPSGYYLSTNLRCLQCSENICQNLLKMQIKSKSIFNILYLRINFNQQISMIQFKSSQNTSNTQLMTVQYKQLSDLYKIEKKSRLLQSTTPIYPLQYKIKPIISSNTIWLILNPQKSLGPIQLKLSLTSHYLFLTKILQNTNSTTILTNYDQYTAQQINSGIGFQMYAKIISSVMCILFLVNLVFNTVYMMYPMIDFYQLLFLLLFLNIDYPPVLNYFLYGFRYAHYLFLPQIFSTGENTAISAKIPEKFGIVVPDANFLTNTGHHFLIMFVVVGVFGALKLIDIVTGCFTKAQRSNRIKNQNGNQKLQGSQNLEKNNNQKSETQCKASSSSSSQQNPQPQTDPAQKSSNQNQNPTSSNSQSPKKPPTFSSRIQTAIKLILNRIRWNYFNDFLYIIYLYLMLFAFCQTLDLTAKEGIHYVSSIIAVVFVIVGIAWPIGLAVMLYYKNDKGQVFKESTNEYERYNSQYKCYVANLKPKSSNMFGLIIPPIRYLKKLLLSALFSYCSNYQNFILSIITTLSILTIITNIIYRPYRNKIELLANCLFQLIFCIGCICLSILMANGIGLEKQSKIGLSIAVVILYLVLSIVICGYNCGVIVVQVWEYFTGVNYMGRFDEPDQDDLTIGNIDKKEGSTQKQQQIGQESNLRLNLTLSKAQNSKSKDRKYSDEFLVNKFGKQQDKVGEINSEVSGESGQSGPMDIYLKQHGKNIRNPQVLIKCVKGAKFTDKDSEDSYSEEQQEDKSKQEEDSREFSSRKVRTNSDMKFNTDSESSPKKNQSLHLETQSKQPQMNQIDIKQPSVLTPPMKNQSNQQSQSQHSIEHKNIFESNIHSPQKIQGICANNVLNLEDEDMNEQSDRVKQSQSCSDNSEIQRKYNRYD